MSETDDPEEKMDQNLRSQLTFVFFCICSFIMLIIYIAVDEQLEQSRAIAVINTHPVDLSKERVRNVKHAPPKCLPVNHIHFLPMSESNAFLTKSLFVHYGLKHHLSFALPTSTSGTYLNGMGHPFTPITGNLTHVIGFNSEEASFDILCHDMILDAAKVYEIMPEDTKFIGLLTHPVRHFRRLWNKYESTWSIKKRLAEDTMNVTDPPQVGEMRTFLEDPWHYLQEPLEAFRDAELLKNHKILHGTLTKYEPQISSLIHTRNPQLFTYGFEVVQKNLVDVLIQSMISSVEAQYHIIVIDEYFDYSLALLKYKLCWSYKDVITIAASIRRPIEPYSEHALDDEMVAKLRTFNAADFQFYETMNNTFWDTVHSIGKLRLGVIKDTIVAQAVALQGKCIEDWTEKGEDVVPNLKDTSKHLQECQRIELVRKNVIKTLQTRQKQLVNEKRRKQNMH